MVNLSNTQQVLRDTVERFERLAEEKDALSDQQKVILAEAKAAGFNVKAIRRVLALRKMGAAEREEFESVVDLYMANLGGEDLA